MTQNTLEKLVQDRTYAYNNPFLQAAFGHIKGASQNLIFGFSAAVAGDMLYDLWPGTNPYPFLDTAEIISVSSDSIEDNPTGTGAGVVLVFGLDENGLEQEETLVLNGTTPVLTTNTFLRVNDLVVVQGAPGGDINTPNIGTITATSNTTAAQQAIILPMTGRATQSVYTVPYDKRGTVRSITISVPESKTVEIVVANRPRDGVFLYTSPYVVREGTLHVNDLLTPLSRGSDFKIMARTIAGGSADVTVSYELFTA